MRQGLPDGRFFCEARDQSRAGFILIDLIAALTVAGLIILLALPQITAFTSRTGLHALLSQSVSTLKDARSLAVASNQNVAAIFDRRSRTLRMRGETVQYPQDLDITVTAGGSCEAEGGRVEIVFSGNGTKCGAILRFAKAKEIYRLRVNWLTGYVETLEGE